MFIHKKQEGEETYLGLNWMSNENTFLAFILVIPIGLIFPKEYTDWFTDNILHGWRIKTFHIRLRIRNWKNFSSEIKKILFSSHIEIKAIGKQKLIATRKMLEDAKYL